MLPTAILDRFVERCPAVVMIRATLERLLRPERLDQIFEQARQRQYCKQLLFSQVVALMMSVATRTHKSVHAAYQAGKESLGVSPAALYDKINHIEPQTNSIVIRQTAADAAKIIDSMQAAKKEILPGLEVFYLDGNHLAATEHRLAELRVTREGPLPGQSLALLDAQRELIVDLVPCEDGHAQERSLLPELLERIVAMMVIIADRNFCTSKFLFGLASREAFFVIRQHASTLHFRLRGRRRRIGNIETGIVYEQGMELHFEGKTLSVRRITLWLYAPTESGDKEINIITNLSWKQATALQAAEAYGTRWTVEHAFQTLTDVLCCEVKTLGYPQAALFAFSTAVLAYNAYAVVKAALRDARAGGDRGKSVGISFDDRRGGDIRGHGYRSARRVLGFISGDAAGGFCKCTNKAGRSSETLKVSQEKTRPEEATANKKKRQTKPSYCNLTCACKKARKKTLKGVGILSLN